MSELERSAVDVVSAWAERPGRTVIFDFNGTLSDDEPILEAIFTEIFAQHLGWQMSAEDYRSDLLGHSDREIVQIAVRTHGSGDPGLVDSLLSLRRALYKRAVSEHSPVSGQTTQFVTRLAKAGVPMALVTGAQREDVLAVLNNCTVGTMIEHLVTEEDVERGKPDPEGFLKGAALLGADPADTLVFEDSVPGVVGAQRAGMTCIAVTGEPANPAVLAAAAASVARIDTTLLAGTGL